MYGNNTIYHRGETYEFDSEVAALRCRIELDNEDNPYAYPEGMGGRKVERDNNYSNYSNHLDKDRSYSKPKTPYHNKVKTIDMPFLNKEKDAIIKTIKSRLKEIDDLLSKL
jgi:hypothetical protein